MPPGYRCKCRKELERVMGFEPTTSYLGSKHSTTELHPPVRTYISFNLQTLSSAVALCFEKSKKQFEKPINTGKRLNSSVN